MKKIVLFGQFSPPVTGEAMVNEYVFNLLNTRHMSVTSVNSSIINNANSVGKFSLIKVYKQISVYTSLFKHLRNTDLIYITPGQSILGALRILPILIIFKMFKVPIIAHWHGYGLLPLLLKHPRIIGYFGSKINKNIFLTHHLKNEVAKLTAQFNNSVVITNYIVEPQYHRQTNPKSNEPLNALYLGSLMEEKGFELFLLAAKSLRHIKFSICGSGSEKIIEKVIEVSKNFVNINYLGTVSGMEKENILQESDVFVLQSHYKTEGVPLSILEAMASRCAIITTEHNGIPETVGDAAIYVEKNNYLDLEKKLENFNRNRDLLHSYQQKAHMKSKEFSCGIFDEKILFTINNEIDK